MRRYGLGLVLLVVSAPAGGAPARDATFCIESVAMGQSISISTTALSIPQCTDESEQDCLFFIFLCAEPKAFHVNAAVASCTLVRSELPPLGFTVESASDAIDFAAPFSGDLTCRFEGPWEPRHRHFIDELKSKAEAKGFPCDGAPRLTATDETEVTCNPNP